MTSRRRVLVAGGLVAAVAMVAVAAPLIAPYDPATQLDLANGRNLPPSFAHPLGTDQFSRDILSRMLWGARLSLGIGVLAVGLAVTLGTTVGLMAGWVGGRTDAVLMRVVDGCIAMPRIFIVLMVLALWETGGVAPLVLVLGATGWFGTSRLVRAEVQSLRHRDFVTGLRALGASPGRILLRHILPNAAGPVLVSATLGIGQVILLEAGLSYLGVGVRPPTPSWGAIIRDGTEALATAPWIATAAGLGVVLTVTLFSLLGDALRDALDPRTS